MSSSTVVGMVLTWSSKALMVSPHSQPIASVFQLILEATRPSLKVTMVGILVAVSGLVAYVIQSYVTSWSSPCGRLKLEVGDIDAGADSLLSKLPVEALIASDLPDCS